MQPPLKYFPRAVSVLLLAGGLVGSVQAALLSRDLDGNPTTAEAYYDTLLNITWLGDADYARTSGYDADGKMNWNDANLWASLLDINGHDDWRLPYVGPVNGVTMDFTPSYDGSTDASYNYTSPNKEMAHLFYVTLGNAGMYDTAGALSGCYVLGVDHCFDNQGPFVNLQFPFQFWNDKANAPTPAEAWAFIADRGLLGAASTIQEYRVWAVSDGDVGRAMTTQVPEPATAALLLAGMLGLIARRVF